MKTRILVISDDPALQELPAQLFLPEGVQILTTSKGVSVVFQVYLAQPHLIILDVVGSGIDGEHLLVRLRERSAVPIIAVTSEAEIETRIRYLDQGADQCMTKPFEVQELVARARALLRRTRRSPSPAGQLQAILAQR